MLDRTQNAKKEEVVKRWLSESRIDLESARILYDHKIFGRALFHLQQSNEKLAKGLLLEMGILTPRQLSEDWQTKALLGFLPKEPASYRHRVVPSLLADLGDAAPVLEEWFRGVSSGEFEQKIGEFRKTIQNSRKGIKKLKKRPFKLVDTVGHLDEEVASAKAILDSIPNVTNAVDAQLRALDFGKVVDAAMKSTESMGLKVDRERLPSFSPIKDTFAETVRMPAIGTLAVAFTAILDPLESVTRYPDSKHSVFDENDAYVTRFEQLCEVVQRILDLV